MYRNVRVDKDFHEISQKDIKDIVLTSYQLVTSIITQLQLV